MRLHRITLQDYRGVAERTVEFAPTGLTLVVGPNEIGKTSMIEALDLLVDEKATARKQAIRDAQPVHRDAGPSVEAELSVGAYRLVYRKRWLKAPECELRVLDPLPAQFTGDQAHERFLEILGECGVDRFLWRQLRVDQAGLVVQADVKASTVLASVLGSAETPGTGPEARLHELAHQEFRRYFTEKQHAATGELRAALDELDTARADHEAAERTLAEAEAAIAEYERTGRLLTENTTELTAARAELAALEERARALDGERDQLRNLEARLDSARRLAETAAKVDELQLTVDGLAEQADAAAAQAARAQQARNEAARRAEGLRTASVTARQTARRAGEELRFQIDVQEERVLSERLAKIDKTRERLATTAAHMGRIAITEELLDRIEAAHQEWEIARASMDAGAPTVAVTRLGTAPVHLDDVPLSNATSTQTVPVTEPFTVEAPGVVRIVVTPGAAEHARRDRMVQARAAYDEVCAEAGVADAAAARAANRERRRLLTEHENAERDQAAALAGDDPSALAHKLAQLHNRLAHATQHTPTPLPTPTPTPTPAPPPTTTPTPPSPPTLDHLRDAESAATSAADDAEALARAASLRLAECADALTAAQVEAAKLTARLEATRGEVERSRAELAALPQPVDGEQLADLREAYETTTSRIADLAPDLLDLKLKNARALVPQREQAKVELRERRAAATTRLAVFSEGERGPREAADQTSATLARAQERHDRVQRRAQAARLLFETLDTHRLEARRRYAAPLRDRVEGYAAMVFGPQVRIGVGDDLTIATKTVNGVTVPFEQLSAGAREQLALLGRVSCADLISPPTPTSPTPTPTSPGPTSPGPTSPGPTSPSPTPAPIPRPDG
ncbi:MAG TPA: AAA family ATPase, partial [Actinocrinis sp.]|nr:AAA family ATPase [Actinocrinis sp.]